MKIGTMIKKYRRQKDLTQDQLSEYLNVSVSAVSQWESGKTIPDVSTLLALASFFDVSLDELFDRTSKDKEKAIKEYDERALEYANRGEVANELTLWREATQKYPGDFHCLGCLAHALHSMVYSSDDTDEAERNAKECIVICERILADCKENDERNLAIQLLVHIYSHKEFPFANEQKAVEYAMMAGDLFTCREILLESAYFTEKNKRKQLEVKHTNILNYMDLLCMNLYCGRYETEEEKIEACKISLSLWKTLIYDDNYQFFHCRLQLIYSTLAMCYAKLQKSKETIDALKNAFYHAKCYDNLPDGEQRYTSVFVNFATSNTSKHTKNYINTNVDNVLQFMKIKEFEFLHCNPEFIELEK